MITYLFIGYLIGTYLGVYLNIHPLFLLLFIIIIILIEIIVMVFVKGYSRTLSKILINKYVKIYFFKSMLITVSIIISIIRVNNINNIRNEIYEFSNNSISNNKEVEYIVKIIEKEEGEYLNEYVVLILEYQDKEQDKKQELYKNYTNFNKSPINSSKKIKAIFRTKADLSIAKTYKIAGNLKRFKEEINYKGFNERKYYYSKGIYFRLKVSQKENYKGKIEENEIKTYKDKNNNKLVDDITEIKNNKFQAFDYILLIKEKINNNVDKYIINSGIFKALFLGNSNELDEDIKQNFKITNVYHVLAMSGMHISYLILILNIVFKKSKLHISYKLKKIIQILILIIYLLIVGSTTSVSRAVFSAIIILILKEFNIKYGFLNSMLFSIFVIILINPYIVYNVGFYLSYIATISIYFFLKIEENLKLISRLITFVSLKIFKNKGEDINIKNNTQNSIYKIKNILDKIKNKKDKKDERKKSKNKKNKKDKKDKKDIKYYIEKVLSFIFLNIYISVVVYISLFPLLIYFFNEISINFLIANLILSLILPVIMILGFIFIFVTLFFNLILALSNLLSFISNIVDILNTYIISKLAKILDVLLSVLIQIVEKVSSLDNVFNNILYLRSPSIIFIIMYYIIICFVFYIFATNTSKFYSRKMYITSKFSKAKKIITKRKILSFLIILILIFSNIFLNLRVRNGEYKLSYISVGQGDSSFIVTPKNTTILIDAGSNQYFDNGREVRRYIFARRQKNIDHLFISHFDIDHIGGVYTLIDSIKIGKIYIPKYIGKYLEKEIIKKHGSIKIEVIEELKKMQEEKDIGVLEEDFLNYYFLKQKAKEKNIEILELERGDDFMLDKDTSVEVLFPIKDLINMNFSNNNSLVFKLKCYSDNNSSSSSSSRDGNSNSKSNRKSNSNKNIYNFNSKNNKKDKMFSIIYTGDIEKDAIKKLLELDELGKSTFSLKSDILKVPHHGSKYSLNEKFLKKINPNISIISAAENNIYGHPHREVLESLEEVGSKIYKTNISGEIFLTENEIFSY